MNDCLPLKDACAWKGCRKGCHTSCGELHDFLLHQGYLGVIVEAEYEAIKLVSVVGDKTAVKKAS